MLDAHETTTGRQVCSGGHPDVVRAGLELFQQGGNVIDAIVAMGFMGFVVEPIDCGLGGFCRVSTSFNNKFYELDGYVRAPFAAQPDMFKIDSSVGATYYGHPVTKDNLAKYGALSVATPGALPSLLMLHKKLGRLSLQRVLQPAIEQAEEGVDFSWRDKLVIAELQDEIRRLPDTAAFLMPEGRLPKIPLQFKDGDKMDLKPLAQLLKKIAEQGSAAIYSEEPARQISKYLQAMGGILEESDFLNYRPSLRESQGFEFQDHKVTTCSDSISQEFLQIWDQAKRDKTSLSHYDLFARALGASFVDTLHFYGDPTFVNTPLDGLLSVDFARERFLEIKNMSFPLRAGDPWKFSRHEAGSPSATDASSYQMQGTTQMIAGDKDGNTASLCTAVGWDFGSLVYLPEFGFFLNNGMSFFDPREGRPNSIAGGKAPTFGAPVLTSQDQKTGDRYASAGSGGYRIQTAVLSSYLEALRGEGSMRAALEAPRVHNQGGESFVDDGLAQESKKDLLERGHQLQELREEVSSFHFGRVCLLRHRNKSKTYEVSAYPKHLTAVGVCD